MTWAEAHLWQLIWGSIGVGTVWMVLVTWWALRHEGKNDGH